MEKKKGSSCTSWQKVHNWYDSLVGEDGHYYHKTIIIPKVCELLELKANSRLLDLGSGQGILSRKIPQEMLYLGLDFSKDLVKHAQNYTPKNPKHTFLHHDVTQPLPIKEYVQKHGLFTHATFILSLQNMQAQDQAIANTKEFLEKGAKLLLVMNHPAFRIPRKSHWGFDEHTKTQYRRLDCYMSCQKIPIHMHPGKKGNTDESATWSFHHPISSYSSWLKQNGFAIELIEEWCSDKVSTGKAAVWENRARKEFPLFLALLATKK